MPLEQALEELEEVVAALEEGSLTLDQSLQLFEKGIRLVRIRQIIEGRAADRGSTGAPPDLLSGEAVPARCWGCVRPADVLRS